ncbi:MAG: FHA domain-containing protein [Lachnospiraceae bacterium]|nr:FHA domain-containing protein [Lachnospiraceae bacterium]
MNVEYLRTAKKSYMIVKDADYPFDAYELKMVLHNDISCLLPLQVIVEDGKVEYWYEVTGMQSLKKQFSLAPAGEGDLRGLLRNLIEMKSAMDEYLLDDASIWFSSDMVYEDRFSGRILFCYIPGLSGQQPPGLKDLFEEILQQLNHADPAAVKMGYEMYERCARSEFVIEDCFACLDLLNPKEEQAEPRMPYRECGELPRAEGEPDRDLRLEEEVRDPEYSGAEVYPGKRLRRKRKRVKRGKREEIDYGEILTEQQEILYAAENIGGGHTEVFAEENRIRTWELIYKGDGMETDLRPVSYPFLIGTDERCADGVLQSRTVSRMHARLMLEEGRLYAEDFNSTNGTYLNQQLMPMNTPVELHEGDRIVFATEEYLVASGQMIKKP